ncbi:MAG: purine/pyrimidine permease [Rhodospirillaceae bacterium]|nr:purine/pyrimidine permease [Rhodospirillaceae bacterium]
MSAQAATGNDDVRYEPNERPAHILSVGLGFQAAMLTLAGIVLTPAIVIRVADQGESYLNWAVFAALVISGLSTILQAVRVGRFGAGHILIMGTSGAFIAVSVAALVEGGPGLLAILVIISAVFQFALAARLSFLRRLITPVVAGTVIALIAATVMPILFDMLTTVPRGTPAAAAPASAAATLLVSAALALRASGIWRLWAPIIGIAVGYAVAVWLGLADFSAVVAAGWVGIPDPSAWPGLDLSFDRGFWVLLPAFAFVTLVGAIETIGDSVAIQRVSRRNPQATDYRTVQGAVNADGVGNLLSGIAGTVPNTTYSSSVPFVELTGVGARSVGVVIGVVFLALAFLPKVTAFLLTIPNPVVAAYAILFIGLLFVQGMKIALQDGVDYRKATIIGLAFWIGTGFQNQAIFADQLGFELGTLLGNGMTAGSIVALVLTMFVELTSARRRRLKTDLDMASLPQIDEFLREFANKSGWDEAATQRLALVGEETLTNLLSQDDDEDAAPRRLHIVARRDRGVAELEFLAASDEDNIEDHLAHLTEQRPEITDDERQISFRLLQHYASSVRHQKYHDLDIVTVHVTNVS